MTKKQPKLKLSDLKHGMRVRCKIGDVQIDDAKIFVGTDDRGFRRWYVCQNHRDGGNLFASDKHGYKYAWWIGDELANHEMEIENDAVSWIVKSAPRRIEDGLREGDVLVSPIGAERTVLGLCGRVFLLSMPGDVSVYGSGYTIEGLIARDYKLKEEPQSPPKVSLTPAEIEEKLGMERGTLEVKP